MTPKQRASQAVKVVVEASGYSFAMFWTGFKWTFAPVVDSWDGLSLNRFLAILFALNACHVHLLHWQLVRDNLNTSWQDVMIATLAGSLAFGKDVWIAYLEKKNGDDHHDAG